MRLSRQKRTSKKHIVMAAVARTNLSRFQTFRNADAIAVLHVTRIGVLVRKYAPSDILIDGAHQWIVNDVLHGDEDLA